LLYPFSPTGAIFGLSYEDCGECNTEQMKAISPNSHPRKGNRYSADDVDKPLHTEILL
jgi:hypothetical protein